MGDHLRIFLIPLIVIAITAAIIVSIGSLLLAVGKTAAVPTALGLAVLVMAICTFLATRTPTTQRNG